MLMSAEAYDAFVQQWFFEVVVPEYQFDDVLFEPIGSQWRVTGTITNVGSGTMPVQVAASRGVRFPELLDEEESTNADPYRDARAAVTLGAGDSASFEILSDFEPERLVVDPDAMVLQLRREYAEEELEG